jgi:hypothetical protein
MSDPAVSRERAFIAREYERINAASDRLKSLVFWTNDERRSAEIAAVVEALEQVTASLKEHV